MKTDDVGSHFRGIVIAILALVVVIGLLHLPGSVFDRHEWMSDVLMVEGFNVVPIELKIGDVNWEIDYCVRHGEARVTRKELKQ